MGVVYLAEQREPIKRHVALKVIKLGMDTREVVARFEAERQTLALMEHPNIAAVLDAGATPDGRPYFVMEHVAGVPLTDYCDRHRLDTRQRVRLFLQVCAAVQHAHQKGIIHRDLKPSNVLVAEVDGRPVPKVIDFGIAKATAQHEAEQTVFTQQGTFVGTPEYMSPEQADLRVVDIDTRTDIYSLGVILYELLTGALPFDAAKLRRAGLFEMHRVIREQDPPKPSSRVTTAAETANEVAERRHTKPPRLAQQLRGDLDWITLKALEKDRARRYPSASEFAADIERYLADEPVTARPPSARYRLEKAIRRHRVAVAAGAAVFAALLLGLVVAITLYVQAHRARVEADRQAGIARTNARRAEASAAEADLQRGVAQQQTRLAESNYTRAETERQDAEHQRAVADQENYAASIAAASLLLEKDQRDEARARLAAAPAALRGWEWRYLSARIDESLAVIGGDGGAVTSLAYTADGTRLIWTSAYGVVREADRRTSQPVETHVRATAAPESVVAVTPDGSRYVTAPWLAPLPGTPALYAYVPGKPAGQQPTKDDREAVQLFAVARTTRGYPPGATRYQLPPERPEAARTLSVQDGRTGSVVARLVLPRIGISAPVPLSRSANRDVSEMLATEIGIRDVTGTDRYIANFGGQPGSVVSVALSANGRRAVAWSWDNVLTVWDTHSGALLATLQGHRDGVTQAALTPDGYNVVSASLDGTIRIWPLSGGDPILVTGHNGPVSAVAVSVDGRRIASGGADRTIRIWDRSGRAIGVLRGHQGGVTAVAWSPDGTTIASGAYDKTLRLWDAERQQPRGVLPGHIIPVVALAFSPDGREVASGSNDGWVRVWSTVRQQPVQPDSTIVNDHVYDMYEMSADSGRVITPAWRSQVLYWWSLDAPGRFATIGSTTGGLPRAPMGISPVALSRDGRRAVSGSANGSVTLYNLDSPGAPQVLRNTGTLVATQAVTAVATNADGTRAAAASLDRAVRTWNVRTGRATTLASGTDQVGGLAFTPDGSRLAAGVEHTVRVWDVERGVLVRQSETLPSAVSAVAFSPDARWLAAGCVDGTIRIWNAASGETVATLRGEATGGPRSMAFNAAGTRLAVAYPVDRVAVWDSTSSHLLLQLPVAFALRVAFTADETRLLVLSKIGVVTVFDARSAYTFDTQELVRRLYREHGLSADVIARIRADTSLAPALRDAAERLARAQGDVVSNAWIAAEELARVPTRTRRDCERALAWADTAVRMMPGHPLSFEVRGLALYRLGRLEECVRAFRRAVELRNGYELVDLVFLRMAALSLGRDDEGRRLAAEQLGYLARLQGVGGLSTVEYGWLAELNAAQAQAAKRKRSMY
jgi:WD40 repeat protein